MQGVSELGTTHWDRIWAGEGGTFLEGPGRGDSEWRNVTTEGSRHWKATRSDHHAADTLEVSLCELGRGGKYIGLFKDSGLVMMSTHSRPALGPSFRGL